MLHVTRLLCSGKAAALSPGSSKASAREALRGEAPRTLFVEGALSPSNRRKE